MCKERAIRIVFWRVQPRQVQPGSEMIHSVSPTVKVRPRQKSSRDETNLTTVSLTSNNSRDGLIPLIS